jgi:transcriptional regulator with XRE-family HTH domain
MQERRPVSKLANGTDARLKAARLALGLSQRKIAKELGVAANRWNQWETGQHDPSILTMVALKLRYDITLDWIYAGDIRRIPVEIADRIRDIAKAPDAPVGLTSALGLPLSPTAAEKWEKDQKI